MIGIPGYFLRALTPGGVIASIFIGTVIFGTGGISWAIPLIFFFISSSVLSKHNYSQKYSIKVQFQKGDTRDFFQVLANGGIPLFCGLIIWIQPDYEFLWTAGFTGALCTATADTWSTEIGVLSKTPPRLITTGTVVPPGTSGGLSFTGTIAGTVGAISTGVISWAGIIYFQSALLSDMYPPVFFCTAAAIIGGITGNFLDSLLGATIQAQFYCSTCQTYTECSVHHCGSLSTHVSGISWIHNDLINFISIGAGATICTMLIHALI